MKARVRINSCPPSDDNDSPHFPYRTIDVERVVIPGVDYQYFVAHQLIKSNGFFEHAYSVTEYQTGIRISPVGKFAYSVEQAVEQTIERFQKERVDDELLHRRIDTMLDKFGRANEIDPANWPE